jgi:hypothetical protein
MFTTKIRTMLALAGATLGIAAAGVPAQAAAPAQPPTRPPTIRLQGASTTVTVFRPAGTRNVYTRATTIKRTLNGTIVRAVNRIPIRWTVTKPIIVDGRVVARVSCGATGTGASQARCDKYADAINSWGEAVDEAVVAGGGAYTDAVHTAINNYVGVQNAALDAGCFIVY